MIDLNNGILSVGVDIMGAELKSIKRANDNDDIEYLWQFDPGVWERQAPLLFPFIGRLKDGEYLYDGKMYKTDIHGFARYREFTVISRGNDWIDLQLCHDEETLVEYPFEFQLDIIYRLEENKIIKEHIIKNTGRKIMYFEIGGHEGYNIALYAGERMEDYFIEFEGSDHLMTFRGDEDIMLVEDKERVELTGNRLYLAPEVFAKDALIMEDVPGRRVSLRNDQNCRTVTVEFNDFDYLGIWTKYMRGNYICIEPWSSLPDCSYLGKEIEDKKGIRKLEPGESERLIYTISME